MKKPTPETLAGLDHARRGGWLFAALALVVCVVWGALAGVRPLLEAYLFAYLFWFGVAMGCLAFRLVHRLTRGAWGEVAAPIWDAAIATIPWMALLFVPVALGLFVLYPWAHEDPAALEEVVRAKLGYLNPVFFYVRSALILGLWSAVAVTLTRRSRRHPEAPPLSGGAAGALVCAYVLTVSVLAVDWVLSLEPAWYSSGSGFILAVGQATSGLAFTVIALARRSPPAVGTGAEHAAQRERRARISHHLGNLLLMCVMLWAYLSFMQYLIIWAGDSPHQTAYYVRRGNGAWRGLGLSLIAVHFGVPFVLLLFRRLKRSLGVLGLVAVGLFVVRALDTYLAVAPARAHGAPLDVGATARWLDPVLWFGLGGLWVVLFTRALRLREGAGGAEEGTRASL